MSKPPLWEVMDDGMDVQASKETGKTDPLIWRRIRAAEIRAVRDWLVPEEESPTDERLCRDWVVRMRLRDKLTAEAEKAERGEGNDG